MMMKISRLNMFRVAQLAQVLILFLLISIEAFPGILILLACTYFLIYNVYICLDSKSGIFFMLADFSIAFLVLQVSIQMKQQVLVFIAIKALIFLVSQTFVRKFNWRYLGGDPLTYKLSAFDYVLLTLPFLINFKILMAGSNSKLTFLLSQYDIVGHSYLIKIRGICGGALEQCFFNGNKLPDNRSLFNYPHLFHDIFSVVFHGSFENVDSYLTVIVFIIVWVYSIVCLIMYKSMQKKFSEIGFDGIKASGKTVNSRISFTLNFSIFLVSFFGPLNLFINLGYLNFVVLLIVVLFLVTNEATLQRSTLYLLLIFCSEVWTLFYFISILTITLDLLINRIALRIRDLLVASLAFFGFFHFIYVSITSNQADAIFVQSRHWPEVIFSILVGFYLFSVLRKHRIHNRLSSILLVSLILGNSTLFLSGMATGQLGSYYNYKLSVILLVLESAIIVFSVFFMEQVSPFEQDVSRKVKKQRKFVLIKKSSQLSKLLILIAIVSMFQAKASAVVGLSGFSSYGSSLNMFMDQSLPGDSRVEYISKSVKSLNYSDSVSQGYLVDANTYWYHSSQWLNNFNNSWGDDVQEALDEINSQSRSPRELKSFLAEDMSVLRIRELAVISDTCKFYLEKNLECLELMSDKVSKG